MDANDHWQQARNVLWTIEVEREDCTVDAFIHQISLNRGIGNLHHRLLPRLDRLRRRPTQGRNTECVN
jgi:hypothetical protein